MQVKDNVFRPVWARSPLNSRQVKEMISPKENQGHGLLNSAAESGRVDMFTAVMATISGKLTDTEVRRCTVG